ncbi:hypothetical protein RIF29_11640 [Crotalaria pallida]|uniref:Uncharacterized protein n=1 Tax=Crotalaria pallida TaxID=3830 RepID=A0AAN9IMA8_CROPI
MKQDIKCSPMVYMSKHRLQQLQLLRVKGQFCKIPSGFPYLPRFLTFFSHFTSNPTSLLLQLHPFYYSFKHQAEQLRTTLRASIIKHQTPPAPHFELHSAYSAYHQHHRRSLPHTRCPSVSVSVSVLVSLPVSVQIIGKHFWLVDLVSISEIILLCLMFVDQDPIEAAQALCSRSRHPYHLLPVNFIF